MQLPPALAQEPVATGKATVGGVTVEASLVADGQAPGAPIAANTADLTLVVHAETAGDTAKPLLIFFRAMTHVAAGGGKPRVVWAAMNPVPAGETTRIAIPTPAKGFPPGEIGITVLYGGHSGELLTFTVGAPAGTAGATAGAEAATTAGDAKPTATSESGQHSFDLEAGPLHVMLLADAKAEPPAPLAEFPEEIPEIFIAFRSENQGSMNVSYDLFAVAVPGIAKNARLAGGSQHLGKGASKTFGFKLSGLPPARGIKLFPPGDYQVTIAIKDGPAVNLPFKVAATNPYAELAATAPAPDGLNIALAHLGGRIESFTSKSEKPEWAVENLIDGFPLIMNLGGNNCDSCGWSSADASLPQAFVFSFREGRRALVRAVTIDPNTPETRRDARFMPKHVEVWVSTAGPDTGFERVATARLQYSAAEQIIRFAPTPASYVKVVFLSNFGDNRTQAGEIGIYEAAETTESITADMPKNLAAPALGGAIVRFQSQRDREHGVYNLVDGGTETPGWVSATGFLPQDLVFAFRDDRTAYIDRILFNTRTDDKPDTAAKRVSVSVSMDSPSAGFREIGIFDLQQSPDMQAFPVAAMARYVRLRILENFGGNRTGLGEVELIEGAKPGYRSVLLPPAPGSGENASGEKPPPDLALADPVPETEPNNSPDTAAAMPLDRVTRGSIDGIDDNDYFRLDLPADDATVLTLDIAGEPNIRTGIALLDRSGEIAKQFNPGATPREQTAFSWAVEGGDTRLKVWQPPISVVLIWDSSGSMDGSTEDLREAVESYIDNLRPGEQLSLIRFDNDVNILVPDFTSDKALLKAATEGQFRADGGTAFYSAVKKGAQLLEPLRGNKAIIVMSDGGDTASKIDHPAFWQMLDDKKIRVYTIGLSYAMKDYMPGIGIAGDRILSSVARANNGRFLFASTSAELGAFYRTISDELHRMSVYYIKPSVAPGLGQLTVRSTGERIAKMSSPRIELILDASGSMRETKKRIDGKLKIDLARDVLAELVKDLPDDAGIALRVYGHRIREGQKGDCEDSQLLVPFGKTDKANLLKQINGIKALGTTPLAYSVAQAAKDFGDGDGEKVVVLVTDGEEECGGQLKEVVAGLRQQGVNLRFNVVGFALGDEAVKADMRDAASAGGGNFFDAQNREGLKEALKQALATPFDVLDAAGTVIAKGLIDGERIAVPQGVYDIAIRAAGGELTVHGVRIVFDRTTGVELKKEGETVGVNIVTP